MNHGNSFFVSLSFCIYNAITDNKQKEDAMYCFLTVIQWKLKSREQRWIFTIDFFFLNYCQWCPKDIQHTYNFAKGMVRIPSVCWLLCKKETSSDFIIQEPNACTVYMKYKKDKLKYSMQKICNKYFWNIRTLY